VLRAILPLAVLALLVLAPTPLLAGFKNAGAGGCGNFNDVLPTAETGDVLAPMRGGVNTSSLTISDTLVIQGGWAPGEGNCGDAGTNEFADTAAMLAAGFDYDPSQRSQLFGDFTNPVIPLDLRDGRTAVLQNLEISFYSITGNGSAVGGVISDGARLRLENMLFDSDDGGADAAGGAVYLELRGGSQLTIADSVFSNNTAGEGAGLEVRLYDHSSLLIERSEFSGNQAASGNGGGLRVLIESGTVTIRNSSFSNNSAAGGRGGGLALERLPGATGTAVAELSGNTFSANSAASDANIYRAGVTLSDKSVFLPLVQHPTPGSGLGVHISSIGLYEAQYLVTFTTSGYTPALPGQHVHFFFNTVPPEQAGMPGGGPWRIYGSSAPFSEYGIVDRPPGATQMCALVANPDHSVVQGTGNCVDLP
jgi:hypothetical protein